MEDFYEVLGISKNATPEEIKRAYRRLARQMHPDMNSDARATERFKEITRAYEVLSDPEKRRRYDSGEMGFGPEAGAGFEFNLGDLFSTFFGGAANTSAGRKGQDVLIQLSLELGEVIFGCQKTVELNLPTVCDKCSGEGRAPGQKTRVCGVCRGQGVVSRSIRTPLGDMATQQECPACQGLGTSPESRCPQCSGEGRIKKTRSITIDVPAGVKSESRLHVIGEGGAGFMGGEPGDLIVRIIVRPDSFFAPYNDDIYCELEIGLALAVLGGEIEFLALDGPVKLKVAAGAQSGQTQTVSGRGLGRPGASSRGDLKITLQVVWPSKLGGDQKKLFKKFAESLKPHSPKLVKAQRGFRERLRDLFGR